MKKIALLSVVLMLAACGDDDVTPPVDMGTANDMPVIVDMPIATDMPVAEDMGDVDAGPPGPTYSGTISLLEVNLLNPGTSGTSFGQGIQVGVSFGASTDGLPDPVLEETPGSPLGCKAWVYTHDEAALAAIGNDEGPVQITSATGTTPPTFPACTFLAGAGYVCPELDTAQVGGTIAAGPMAGLAMLTDADTTFTVANTANRYVRITGATNATNNGAFPIVALGGVNTVVYANPGFVAETLGATASHINLAGVGPTPGNTTGFLADDNGAQFALTPGGGMHFAAFTATTGGSGTVGDAFTLDIATRNLLNAIPVDGSAITLGCETGSCGGGSATGTLVNITTTDAPLTGLSPFAMPLPTTRRVVVRCSAILATTVTVPAAFSALLMTSGATRIQTTLIRPTLMSGAPTGVNAIAGHAISGFTNPPAP